MKKPDLKQLTMPIIVTFILIIASFTIASKYELKSIIKQPVKINSSSNRKLQAPKQEQKEDHVIKTHEADSSSQSGKETQSMFDRHPMRLLPKEVSIILLSRFQVSLSLPSGT